MNKREKKYPPFGGWGGDSLGIQNAQLSAIIRCTIIQRVRR